MPKLMRYLLFSVLGILTISGFALADSIYPGDIITLQKAPGIHGGGSGGPFLLTDHTTGASFISYCLERNEYFSPGRPMRVDSIGSSAYYGGAGGPSPDPLGMETAWLYRHFREGDLWSLVPTATGSPADHYLLQKAIWMIEQELTPDLGNIFYVTAITPGIAGPSDLNFVRVVNPVGLRSGAHKQSQVTYVPEPTSLLLLGTGLGALGLAIYRRRKN